VSTDLTSTGDLLYDSNGLRGQCSSAPGTNNFHCFAGKLFRAIQPPGALFDVILPGESISEA
jgi:hypothetical protein